MPENNQLVVSVKMLCLDGQYFPSGTPLSEVLAKTGRTATFGEHLRRTCRVAPLSEHPVREPRPEPKLVRSGPLSFGEAVADFDDETVIHLASMVDAIHPTCAASPNDLRVALVDAYDAIASSGSASQEDEKTAETDPNGESDEELVRAMNYADLKALAADMQIDLPHNTKKEDLIAAILKAQKNEQSSGSESQEDEQTS